MMDEPLSEKEKEDVHTQLDYKKAGGDSGDSEGGAITLYCPECGDEWYPKPTAQFVWYCPHSGCTGRLQVDVEYQDIDEHKSHMA